MKRADQEVSRRPGGPPHKRQAVAAEGDDVGSNGSWVGKIDVTYGDFRANAATGSGDDSDFIGQWNR